MSMERSINRNSVGFVASTLPIQIINLYIKEWNINTIVLSDRLHLPSYKYLLKENKGLKFKILPRNVFLSIATLFSILLKIKLSRKRIVFFHEAAWPWFDLFVTYFKPNGMYIPQINNSGRTLVSYQDIASGSAFARMLKSLHLDVLFNVYEVYSSSNDYRKFFLAIKKYPDSIAVYNESYSRELINDKSGNSIETHKKKVIILLGKDWISDEILKEAFSKIIEIILSCNFKCFIKDHPSIAGRLNLDDDRVEYIDPAMPIELIDDDFTFAIGVATAGLLFFKSRAVSIIDAIEDIDNKTKILRKQHLLSIDGGEQIQFIKEISQLYTLLRNSN
jgi:hypothetical protein